MWVLTHKEKFTIKSTYFAALESTWDSKGALPEKSVVERYMDPFGP